MMTYNRALGSPCVTMFSPARNWACLQASATVSSSFVERSAKRSTLRRSSTVGLTFLAMPPPSTSDRRRPYRDGHGVEGMVAADPALPGKGHRFGCFFLALEVGAGAAV